MHPSLLVLVAALFVFGPAHAGDKTLAETLFREGRALMDAGKYEQACPKLEESFNQDPATGTLLALAVCQERAGKLASAWATYTDVAARARKDGRTDREEAAREQAAALAPRLSHVTVEVPAAVAALPGLTITRNGSPLPEAARGTPLPVDPGRHTIEVTATGKRPWRQVVEVAKEPQQKRVTVPLLEDEVPAPAVAQPGAKPVNPPPPATAPEPTPAKSEPQTQSGGFSLRTLGLIVGGAGVVGLGAGSVFAIKAKGLDSDSNSNGHCDATGCDPEGMQLRNDARDAGNVATAFFAAGFVLVGGGSALYFLSDDGSSDERNATPLRVTPRVGLSELGIVLSGAL